VLWLCAGSVSLVPAGDIPRLPDSLMIASLTNNNLDGTITSECVKPF
jgi:hypothetical protein